MGKKVASEADLPDVYSPVTHSFWFDVDRHRLLGAVGNRTQVVTVRLLRDRRTQNLFLLALFVIGAVMAGTAASSGSSGTSIRVGGGSGPVGQTVTTGVAVSVQQSDSFNAFDVTLRFDPSVASVSSVTLGPGWVVPPLVSTIDNASGSLRVAAFQLGAGCRGGTTCALFSIAWKGLTAGSSTVHVVTEQLAGSDGGSAGIVTSVTYTDGNLQITAPVPPTATPNPPTATPTPQPKSPGVNCFNKRRNPRCGR